MHKTSKEIVQIAIESLSNRIYPVSKKYSIKPHIVRSCRDLLLAILNELSDRELLPPGEITIEEAICTIQASVRYLLSGFIDPNLSASPLNIIGTGYAILDVLQSVIGKINRPSNKGTKEECSSIKNPYSFFDGTTRLLESSFMLISRTMRPFTIKNIYKMRQAALFRNTEIVLRMFEWAMIKALCEKYDQHDTIILQSHFEDLNITDSFKERKHHAKTVSNDTFVKQMLESGYEQTSPPHKIALVASPLAFRCPLKGFIGIDILIWFDKMWAWDRMHLNYTANHCILSFLMGDSLITHEGGVVQISLPFTCKANAGNIVEIASKLASGDFQNIHSLPWETGAILRFLQNGTENCEAKMAKGFKGFPLQMSVPADLIDSIRTNCFMNKISMRKFCVSALRMGLENGGIEVSPEQMVIPLQEKELVEYLEIIRTETHSLSDLLIITADAFRQPVQINVLLSFINSHLRADYILENQSQSQKKRILETLSIISNDSVMKRYRETVRLRIRDARIEHIIKDNRYFSKEQELSPTQVYYRWKNEWKKQRDQQPPIIYHHIAVLAWTSKDFVSNDRHYAAYCANLKKDGIKNMRIDLSGVSYSDMPAIALGGKHGSDCCLPTKLITRHGMQHILSQPSKS